MPRIKSRELQLAEGAPYFASGTLRLSRNAGTVRYVSFPSGSFAGTPLLTVRVGSSNMPAGSALPVLCKTTGPGSFRIGLSSYKQGTVIVYWQARI